MKFTLKADFVPTGDQPKAIESLLQRAKTQLKKHRNQTEGL